MKSAQERREALKRRVQQSIKTKDSRGFPTGKNILDTTDYPDAPFYKEDEFGIETTSKGTYECLIDIVPFVVTTVNHPDLQIGDDDYVLIIGVHRDVGPMHDTYICLHTTYGLPCFICEERQRLVDEGHDWKDDVVSDLRPSIRAIYNVIDLRDPEGKIRIFSASHANFEAELVKKVELSPEEMQTFPDLETGRSIQFYASKETYRKASFFKYSYFDFVDREPYPADILQDTYPLDALLNFPKDEDGKPIEIKVYWKMYYDEVQRAFLHLTEGEQAAGGTTELPQNQGARSRTPSGPPPAPEPERKRKWSSSRERTQTAPPQEDEQARQHMEAIKNEEPKKAEPPAARSQRTKQLQPPQPSTSECPYDHQYGTDCDKFPNDCAECDEWSRCSDRQDELKKEQEAAPPPAPPQPLGRTRTRSR